MLEFDGGRLIEREPSDLTLLPPDSASAPGRDEVDELLVVARWLLGPSRDARRVRRVDGTLASQLPAIPRYAAGQTAAHAIPS